MFEEVKFGGMIKVSPGKLTQCLMLQSLAPRRWQDTTSLTYRLDGGADGALWLDAPGDLIMLYLHDSVPIRSSCWTTVSSSTTKTHVG